MTVPDTPGELFGPCPICGIDRGDQRFLDELIPFTGGMICVVCLVRGLMTAAGNPCPVCMTPMGKPEDGHEVFTSKTPPPIPVLEICRSCSQREDETLARGELLPSQESWRFWELFREKED